MENLFLTILNMSLTGAFVIVAICLARLPLKKAPKIISYCLWAVAWLRLAFPITIESALSLIPFRAAPIQQIPPTSPVTVIPPDLITQGVPNVESGTLIITDTAGSVISTSAQTISTDPMQILLTVGAYVWLTGFAIMLIYGITSYIRLKNKMKSAIPAQADVYETDKTKSPFVLGISKPKIYIPQGLSMQERTYIILHERTHIRRRDHIIKIAAYFVLCIHWFNPLAWLAFLLMGADMEMSCDERVMKETDGAAKKEYSDLLLSLSANHRAIGGSPLAFSEGGLKNRIKNVLSFKKSSKFVVAVAIALTVALSMGLLVNGTGQAENNILHDDYYTAEKSDSETATEQEYIETIDLNVVMPPDAVVENIMWVREGRIGEASIHFSGGGESWLHNITTSFENIDGTILNPGEVFSFERATRGRALVRGFRHLDDVDDSDDINLIGNDCKALSILDHVLWNAQLDLLERLGSEEAFGFTVHDENGLPAHDVFISLNDVLDFRFKNNMDYPIIIDAGVNEGEISVSLFKLSVAGDLEQDKVFGKIRETTNVYRTYSAENSMGYEFFGHGDNGQIFPGAVVEILMVWINGRVLVEVTSEGGPDAHNGWQTWKLWIDADAVDIIDEIIESSER